jgi:photosystem II stability/assembly factor-like uncharacterized protein
MLKKRIISLLLIIVPLVLNAQWQKTNITDNAGKITGFVIVGTDLFASLTAMTSTQTGGVYSSKDGGASWQISNNGNTNNTVTSIAAIGSTLFISTDGDGVLVSTDNGSNWMRSNSGLKSLKTYKVMASGTNLYVGTDDGLYISSNNGASWTNLTSSLSNQNITAFIATSSAIVLTNRGYPNYYYSTDNGTTWSDAITGLPMGTSNCYAQFGNDVLNGTINGLYSSSDNGASWKSLGVSGSIYSIADLGGNIFSGTGVLKGISYSSDKGKNWVTNNDGIDQLSLTINAAILNGNEVIIGSTNSSIFKLSLSALGLTGIKKTDIVPTKYELGQNYPNPFNPTTNISFTLPQRSDVKLIVYDALGKETATLANNVYEAGKYEVTFDASNLPSGIYIYNIQSNGFNQSKKMLLIK